MAEECDFDDRTLYIGNLDKNVDEEILYELFLQAGPVERVSIPNNNNDLFRYGFITYKHLSSIDYALELYKGTALYKKEITVKRKGSKGNNIGQSSNNKNQNSDSAQSRLTLDFNGFSQEQLQTFQQAFLLNANLNAQPLLNFATNQKEKWPSWNKPYNRDSRNQPPRPRKGRDRFRGREYGNKPYRNRKNRR